MDMNTVTLLFVQEDDCENIAKVENEFATELYTQDYLGICRLCLEVTTLQPMSKSQFAKEFNNFKFIEAEIGYKLPENICDNCVTKMNEIGSFLKKCKDSFQIYKLREEHCARLKSDSVENQSLDQINQEEVNFESEVFNADECQKNEPKAQHKIKSNTNEIKLCQSCGSSVTSLINHYKTSRSCQPKNFKCSMCNLHFRNAFKLKTHQKAYHWNKISMKRIMCHICSKMFKYEESFSRHVRIHEHGKQFMCEICGKSYSRPSYLRDHKNVHSQLKPYPCKYCGKCFSSKGYQFAHQRKHNKPRVIARKPNESIACGICNRVFTRKGFFERHMLSHSNEKTTHECKKCQINFETLNLYKQHSQTHTDKRHVCNLCSKRFNNSNYLADHLRVHTGERPFQCSQCERRFRTKGNLSRHTMLVHNVNKGKPFECKFCEKTFSLKENCVVHERIHTGERPHKCHVCDQHFIDSSSRKKHVRKAHGEDEVKNINF